MQSDKIKETFLNIINRTFFHIEERNKQGDPSLPIALYHTEAMIIHEMQSVIMKEYMKKDIISLNERINKQSDNEIFNNFYNDILLIRKSLISEKSWENVTQYDNNINGLNNINDDCKDIIDYYCDVMNGQIKHSDLLNYGDKQTINMVKFFLINQFISSYLSVKEKDYNNFNMNLFDNFILQYVPEVLPIDTCNLRELRNYVFQITDFTTDINTLNQIIAFLIETYPISQ